MRKRYKIFLAFLLVFTMIIPMGTSGFTQVELVEEEYLIEDQDGSEEPVDLVETVQEEEADESDEVEEQGEEASEEQEESEEREESEEPEDSEAAEEASEDAEREGKVSEEQEESEEPEENFEESEELVDEDESEETIEERIEETSLAINHILRIEFQEDDLMTEVIENLEVGSHVYSNDYIVNHDGISFIESDVEELSLVKDGNILNLYYELMPEDEYTPENPDFPLGEGQSGGTAYIEEFSKGSLGPFVDENLFNHRNLRVMNFGSYPDEVNNKVWPEEGSLKIDKTGQAIEGTGNQWEIRLDIEGKDSQETSDIVLVIDRSGSMEGQRLIDAKVAAKDFVNTLFSNPNKTNIRIAVVSFSGTYKTANTVDINAQFTGVNGKQTLLNAIDGLVALGGTHIQAGLRQANALLNASTADYKTIVLLGDGAATHSFKPYNPNSYLENWKYQSNRTYYRTKSNIPQSGFDYGTTIGNGSTEYTQYETGNGWNAYSNNYRHGAHAIAEAGFGKAAGYEIYSIALDAGSEGEWTLEEIADPGNYYETPDSSNLNLIFQEIAGMLSNAATHAVVTDPLGGMYSILGINSSNYNSLISVSHGTLSYDTANDTITWNIGTISEGTNYWMKYTVALDYSADGGVFYPANKPTYIDYKNIDGDNAKKYFPIPEFRLRALTLTKVVTEGSSDMEFDIILEGPVGPYSKTWAVSLKNNESKTIKGLLPGSYTLKEIVPMNYENISIDSNITISEDDWVLSSEITNKKSNDGWFDDDDQLINVFKVGITENNNGKIPSQGRFAYAKLDYFIVPSSVEESYKNKG